MEKEVLAQILTNQLCILATLETMGDFQLLPIQQGNIENRIKETKEIRDKLLEEIE